MLRLRDELQSNTGLFQVLRWALIVGGLLWPPVGIAGDDLKLCFRADAAPFSYMDESGRPDGYTIELCERVATQLGQRTQMIEVTSENRFETLREGQCDLLCEATSVTMARRKVVEFSLITFLTGSALLYPNDLLTATKTDRKVTVGYLRGTTVEDQREAGRLIGGDKANFEFVPYKSHEIAEAALDRGTLQGYIADREILNLMMQNTKKLAQTHRISRDSFTYEPYAIAVKLGDDKRRIAIDQVLAELYRSGSIDEIIAEFIPSRSEDPLLKQLFEIQSLPE